MNQKIIEYLTKYKDQFSQEQLVKQLRNAGYAENEIQESVKNVYELPILEKVPHTDGWGVYFQSFFFYCITTFLLFASKNTDLYNLSIVSDIWLMIARQILPAIIGALIYASILHKSFKTTKYIAIALALIGFIVSIVGIVLEGSGLFLLIFISVIFIIAVGWAIGIIVKNVVLSGTNNKARLKMLFILPAILFIFFIFNILSEQNITPETCEKKTDGGPRYSCYVLYAEKSDEPIWCYMATGLLIREEWDPYCGKEFHKNSVDSSDCETLSDYMDELENARCELRIEEWDLYSHNYDFDKEHGLR